MELRLVETIPNVTTTLEDWTVFPSTQAPDSLQFAARRHLWTMISWVLLSIAAIGVALAALKKDAGEAVTARTLVGAIVNDIVGETKTETNKLRAFMKKVVLEEVPADQALTQAGEPLMKGRWKTQHGRTYVTGSIALRDYLSIERTLTILSRLSR